jgi:hypothetical protein
MNAENVRINLPYDQADLKSLLAYVQAHVIELGGRYDMRKPPRFHQAAVTACNLEVS